MTERTWIGADPGGVGNFGVAILKGNGTCFTCSVDYVDRAIDVIRQHVDVRPDGVGIDAPLWWSSGAAGLRKADQWIRDAYRLPNRNVQAVNSMWGSVLAQGMMFVSRIREMFPGVNVTETHPKALLVALGSDAWSTFFKKLRTDVLSDARPDNLRDAIISALAAREGFEGRWKLDLATERFISEQDPQDYWLAPVHYHWPG